MKFVDNVYLVRNLNMYFFIEYKNIMFHFSYVTIETIYTYKTFKEIKSNSNFLLGVYSLMDLYCIMFIDKY